MTPTEQVQEKIIALQTALTDCHPKLPILLRDIHNTLRTDPDLVTQLNDDEIRTIVESLKRQTSTEIITSKTKTSNKALKNIGVIDL